MSTPTKSETPAVKQTDAEKIENLKRECLGVLATLVASFRTFAAFDFVRESAKYKMLSGSLADLSVSLHTQLSAIAANPLAGARFSKSDSEHIYMLTGGRADDALSIKTVASAALGSALVSKAQVRSAIQRTFAKR